MEIRLFESTTDQERLKAFNVAVFGGTASVKAEDPSQGNPFSQCDPITAVALRDDRIVGHLTSTAFGLWDRGQEHLAYWVSGFHVLEETRGTGLGKKLVARITEVLPVLSAVVVVEPSLRAFKANGWLWPGQLTEYVHLVNPGAFLSTITAERLARFIPSWGHSAADLALKALRKPAAWSFQAYKRAKSVPGTVEASSLSRFEEVEKFDHTLDDLWIRSRDRYGQTHVRNAQYLNWQFPSARGWSKFVYRSMSGEGIDGWGLYALKKYSEGPLEGLTALNLIDLFWDCEQPGLVDQLIQLVLCIAYEANADIVMASGKQTQLERALRRRVFMEVPGTVYVGFGKLNAEQLDARFSGGYFTRGYADAAGGLGF